MSLVLQNFQRKEAPEFKMEVMTFYFLGKKRYHMQIKAANCYPDFSDPTTKWTKLCHARIHGRNKTRILALYALVLALLFRNYGKLLLQIINLQKSSRFTSKNRPKWPCFPGKIEYWGMPVSSVVRICKKCKCFKHSNAAIYRDFRCLFWNVSLL